MCLIAFAWRAHPDYPLVLVANRDEYYARPAQAAHFWPDRPNIFAGRDLEAGGSWLGVTRSGRVAALTNYRDPASHRADAASRGSLVSEYLSLENSPRQYAASLLQQADRYNGFNLLLGDGNELVYYSNRGDGIESLQPGVYGLSNALLDTPWPKTRNAKARLGQWLANPGTVETLARLLVDPTTAEDDELPSTGIDRQLEKALSAQFIELEHYGTRCASALTVDDLGKAEFIEQCFAPEHGITVQQLDAFW